MLLLELDGAWIGGRNSPLIMPVNAENSFSYQPNTMGVSVLPREDVFSLAKLQNLEEKNPNIVLNINDKFALESASNVPASGTAIGSELGGWSSWKANFHWDPSSTQKVNNHLLQQAMDLEVFWSGSYKRSDTGNPEALVWYYGNKEYVASVGTGIRSTYMDAYTEQAGGALTLGAVGVYKNASTASVPLSYNSYRDYFTYEVEFDQRGKLIKDANGTPRLFAKYHLETHPIVVGNGRLIRPTMEKYQGYGYDGNAVGSIPLRYGRRTSSRMSTKTRRWTRTLPITKAATSARARRRPPKITML